MATQQLTPEPDSLSGPNRPEHLRPRAAAAYTGVSPSKLAKLRMNGQRHLGPPFIKICGSVIYRRTDLDQWLAAHRVTGNDA